jgi:hypothetical protein
MFIGTVLRVALGIAIGAGALACVAAARRRERQVSRTTNPSAIQPDQPDDDALMDEALAETFPASDPLACTASVVLGPPPR